MSFSPVGFHTEFEVGGNLCFSKHELLRACRCSPPKNVKNFTFSEVTVLALLIRDSDNKYFCHAKPRIIRIRVPRI